MSKGVCHKDLGKFGEAKKQLKRLLTEHEVLVASDDPVPASPVKVALERLRFFWADHVVVRKSSSVSPSRPKRKQRRQPETPRSIARRDWMELAEHVKSAPAWPHRSFARSSVAQLRVGDDGQLVRICGTITRAGPVKAPEQRQCGHSFGCRASAACGYDFEVPRECPGGQKQTKWDPKAKRPKVSKCHSKLFASLPHDETCMADFQEIRVQDDMQAMGVGVVPQSCAVTVFGDLVGVAQPGDAVMVEGLVFQRWRPTWQGKRVEVEMFIEATNVERLSRDASDCGKVMPETEDTFRRFWSDYGHDEWQGRAALVTSTAPWLSGLPVPKLALLG
ncbi:unnamed protein product [Cladocopium goreaui]|uniref:DNA helicase MCM9 (Minichromosome maintenanc e 9) n=1 Tax=Cladocopium goreaui TaxID=2562237 RepID=A0A9P1FI45_9DINO|nr:unnamed protein product [Cladocopium goreaui]